MGSTVKKAKLTCDTHHITWNVHEPARSKHGWDVHLDIPFFKDALESNAGFTSVHGLEWHGSDAKFLSRDSLLIMA